MKQITPFSSPFLLGFSEIENALSRVTKAQEGYPPYNLEHVSATALEPEKIIITLAVAGFSKNCLEIVLETNELIIRGHIKQPSEPRVFLHKGIATRQFTRRFILAEGMEINEAELKNGLLSIALTRPQAIKKAIRIDFIYIE
jgi:HSP20 family molecular chaperone IbpA